MDIFIFSLSVLFLGLGLWLFLAASNNFIDRKTNTDLLHRMYSMIDIKKDNNLGVKLLYRSVSSPTTVRNVLNFGILIEYVISAFLLLSFFLLLSESLGVGLIKRESMVFISGLTLIFYMFLWFSFLIKGLWFAYWIKLGEVQLVHFILLIVSILSLIYFSIIFH